ncbi:MAG: hypothetical protein AAF517_22295 [Planctomycetota bacterium]
MKLYEHSMLSCKTLFFLLAAFVSGVALSSANSLSSENLLRNQVSTSIALRKLQDEEVTMEEDSDEDAAEGETESSQDEAPSLDGEISARTGDVVGVPTKRECTTGRSRT